MFINLHALPEGKALYTVWVGDAEDCDEYDIILPRNLSAGRVTEACRADAEFLSLYGTQAVIGVVDQSTGQVLRKPAGAQAETRWFA
jgi:hypothetical protein